MPPARPDPKPQTPNPAPAAVEIDATGADVSQDTQIIDGSLEQRIADLEERVAALERGESPGVLS
jgi:hypothetical protein